MKRGPVPDLERFGGEARAAGRRGGVGFYVYHSVGWHHQPATGMWVPKYDQLGVCLLGWHLCEGFLKAGGEENGGKQRQRQTCDPSIRTRMKTRKGHS